MMYVSFTCATLLPDVNAISFRIGLSITAREPHTAPLAPRGDHALT